MSVDVLDRTRFADDDGETFTPDGVPDTDPSVDDLDVGKGLAQLEDHLKAAAPAVEAAESVPVYDWRSRRLLEAAGVLGVRGVRRHQLISGASQTAMRNAGVAGALGVGRRY